MRITKSLLLGYSLVGLLIGLGNTSLFSQNQKSFIIKNSLALNWQEEIGVVKDLISYSTVYDTSQVFSMNFVNPAVMFGSKGRSHHEIELSRIAFSSNEVTITVYYDSLFQQGRIQHYNEKIFQLGLAYFYNHRFSSTPKSLEFYLGTGVSYSTTSSTKIPVSEQIYPWYTRKSNKHQLDLLLRPKVLYHLSERFLLDVSIGISLFQYYTHIYTNEGSIFTTQPEKVKIEKDDFFAQMFRMSVGIGYKL